MLSKADLMEYIILLCLQALFPFKDWWVVPAKVAFDQTIWSAIWNSIYFVVLGFLRLESPTTIYSELKSTFWPMLTVRIHLPWISLISSQGRNWASIKHKSSASYFHCHYEQPTGILLYVLATWVLITWIIHLRLSISLALIVGPLKVCSIDSGSVYSYICSWL